ncbi:TlpA disulfide reductase family protein [Bacteroides gallinaceum]|uniref:TlpA disulfide reductase family protein n=1 Tax=Bacteroides gallinaceum TaxID=1462571 RepID=UPI0025A3CE09|nr:TlpA disulfide reductase family protein [Bacteroides gallinaceum]MDM8154512.1 TlpA disulfide reductase family protein [Bacteroides gallinaceum]
MKRNAYIAAALLLSGLSACNNEPAFTVEGEITDAAEKMLYLEQTGLESIVPLDSVKLSKGGSFSFSASRPEAPDYYRLRIDNKIINFAVDSTETVTVKANYGTFSTGYQIEGSENNTKIKELVLLQAGLQADVNRVAQSGLPIGIAQDSIQRMVNTYKNEVKRNYIFAEPNKTYAYFALFQQLNGYMIFDPLTNREDVKCFAAVATSMNNLYPHADRSRNLYNMVIKGMKNTRAPQAKPLDIPMDKIEETSIIDIPLRDVDGKLHHLTDLKGKVVLIDFTVYGASESGARNLLLRELYNKYHEQGLEIYQVSLDTDEHFWKTAADNLPWICVRDPEGPYSTFVRLYGVAQLPSSFLVNRNNELSLRVDAKTDLDAEIKKIL